jgi:hypothetical protein
MAATDRNTRTAHGRGRASCGFCEPAHGQPAGICHDTGRHCRGTWPGFVPATTANPDGSWTCACSEAGYPGKTAD